MVDTTPPVLQVQDLVQEATGPDGAVVTFAPVVTDAVSPDLVAGCAPASGSTFGLGSTPVSCSASDAAIAWPADAPKVGDVVWLQPGHIDPTINLYDALIVVDEDGSSEIWPVDARRSSR